MGMRPQAARWFELLTPREQLAKALDCLAFTGSVELQVHSQPEEAIEIPGLEGALEARDELARRYSTWWPEPEVPPLEDATDPAEAMKDALERLDAWSKAAEPMIREAEKLDLELAELSRLDEALGSPGMTLPNLGRLASAGPVLGARLYQMPPGVPVRSVPPSVIVHWIQSGETLYVLAIGPRAQVETLDRQMSALKARRLSLPDWLPDDPAEARDRVRERIRACRSRRADIDSELETLSGRHALARALGDLALMEWFAGQAPSLPVTQHFAWVTGWTSDTDGMAIEDAMARGNVKHLLRFTEPPPGLESPTVLKNPSWIRPFEMFARLIGMPAATEADPSRLVAVIAPLLFGYMFGDVGQGAVLLAAGLVLRRRFPVMGLLVSGGLMAMVFGLAFGSVFAREDIIPALWLHPLTHPLPVLGVTLAFGVFIILLGLFLDALQSFWRRRAGRWLATRGGLTAAYVGLVGAFVHPPLLWLMILGMVWFVAGSALTSPHHLRELPAALGELVESMLQMAVNTVSFVRVGAFALAHAGLSAAVVGMAEGVPAWASLIIMMLGNLLIITLEGLVVGIQTTRLVLFEFFIRFLTAEGRQLRPLARPGPTSHTPRRTT
ncbi:MAG: V-type ATPase 116kDa subunit family protein [Gammaproteobacteria bacterium]